MTKNTVPSAPPPPLLGASEQTYTLPIPNQDPVTSPPMLLVLERVDLVNSLDLIEDLKDKGSGWK